MRSGASLARGFALFSVVIGISTASRGQTPQTQTKAHGSAARATAAPVAAKAAAHPKLVVMIVVDQMRADYIDKFVGQWKGGLRRLVERGAWYRAAAYPYAATETCVGHSTVSTGAFPATHGMIANAWWDRDAQKNVTCTSDPKAKNIAYDGGSAKGGDSAWRMAVPAFAEELKFQTGAGNRVATFSLKARAAITMAGHRADAVTWFDAGAWTTSNIYGLMPFVEDYAKAHRVKNDLGKTWNLSLPRSEYWYNEKATGAHPPQGWDLTFPHPLRSKDGGSEADEIFYEEWASSPFADSYLTKLAETAVDSLGLGRGGGADFLGVSYSSVDYVGHAFGPRSWEIQDVLVRLDRDLRELFAHLDQKVGAGNYVVAFSADHGVVPIPEDMQSTGADAGWLNLADVKSAAETALEPLGYPKPAVTGMSAGELYFAPGIYDKLQSDKASLKAVIDAIERVPGVLSVYGAEDVAGRPPTKNPLKDAVDLGYFAGRSGDLLIVPKPYWPMGFFQGGDAAKRGYGTTHGTPYYYDQRVPILLMGWGIQPGQYLREVTPADIAPTLAVLCGITLAGRDGHVLTEAVRAGSAGQSSTAHSRH